MSAFGLDATFFGLAPVPLMAFCRDSPTSASYLLFEHKAQNLFQLFINCHEAEWVLCSAGSENGIVCGRRSWWEGGEKHVLLAYWGGQSWASTPRGYWHPSVCLVVAFAACRWCCILSFLCWCGYRLDLSPDFHCHHQVCIYYFEYMVASKRALLSFCLPGTVLQVFIAG